jgi:hypothetical protein
VLLKNGISKIWRTFHCQTNHLLAETAEQNFSSQKANKPFIRKKAFRTNHKGAPAAELQGRIASGMADVTDTEAIQGKCTLPYAPSAARRPKCLLGRRPTSPFIARNAISPENAVETDINSALAPAEAGRGFLLRSNILLGL